MDTLPVLVTTIGTELCCAATARALSKPSRPDTCNCGCPTTSSASSVSAVASSALTVTFTTGEGQLTIGLGGHEWVDAAVSGAIGLVAVPPVLLGTAYGIWKENQLDKEVWQVIDERVSAPAEAGPGAGR